MKDTKILICGTSGYIGRHLKMIMPDAHGIDIVDSEWTDEVADMGEYDASKYDIVINAAGQADVEKAERVPFPTFKQNVFDVQCLLESFEGDRFIQSSTVAANDFDVNNYALSKYLAEQFIKFSGKSYLIYRFANVYGAGSRSVVDKFLASDYITVYGDGEQTRDFVHVEDLVVKLRDSMSFLPLNQTYYLGTGVKRTVKELAYFIQCYCPSKTITSFNRHISEIKHPTIHADVRCRDRLKGYVEHFFSGIT